jgi:hypothetical protein
LGSDLVNPQLVKELRAPPRERFPAHHVLSGSLIVAFDDDSREMAIVDNDTIYRY